ncbi:uncharacterized protein LOC125003222 isoform X2 [Mugil cephalus]|uniref:uncharacterized protein LOC125003222 isoform X2 n=1 Tax=Mugil cephalus TaxID=48193 RepID=UPI001FB5A2EF|nr:uncharacterized protein LOC125003222 isoform X2 [Mugil cephalus]
MDRVLTSLLLSSLCATSSWSAASEKLVVTQSPDVSVMEGEMVKINCCWTGNIGEQETRVRVNWLKSQTQNKEDLNMTIQSQVFQKEEENDCSTLTFPSISRENASTYVCRVSMEIPVLVKALGNGTVITVTSNNETSGETSNKTAGDKEPSINLPQPVIIALAVVAPMLLIAVVCFCSLRRKEAQAARVIYEVPHVDSEVDKHSTSSSRGSSQWCQVPVYESFDYFERVQTKESG